MSKEADPLRAVYDETDTAFGQKTLVRYGGTDGRSDAWIPSGLMGGVWGKSQCEQYLIPFLSGVMDRSRPSLGSDIQDAARGNFWLSRNASPRSRSRCQSEVGSGSASTVDAILAPRNTNLGALFVRCPVRGIDQASVA